MWSLIPINNYGIEHLSKVYVIAELLINCLQSTKGFEKCIVDAQTVKHLYAAVSI